ncbi:MAG: hypothetical protein ACXVBJ_01520 [Flavisolibacter sp.]
MFSMIFFLFVAVVAVFGFLAVTWKKKNKVPLDTDVVDTDRTSRPGGAFNERSTNQIKGGMVPTENKLSHKDFDEGNEVRE